MSHLGSAAHELLSGSVSLDADICNDPDPEALRSYGSLRDLTSYGRR